MMNVLKTLEQPLTEELVKSLVGLFVHVPTNLHEVRTEEGERKEENVWFAGQVAGYERAVVAFDFEQQAFREEPQVYYNLLLTDGMGYVLGASEQVEIHRLEEDAFRKMLEEHYARLASEESSASVHEQPTE